MREIEVGEYVRTKSGHIRQIISFCDCKLNHLILDKAINGDSYLSKDEIVKHSKNIIDLIEPGDILEINNEKYEVIYDKSYEKLGILISNRHQLAVRHCSIEYIFSKNGIEEFKNVSILTHEQFKSLEYRLEE